MVANCLTEKTEVPEEHYYNVKESADIYARPVGDAHHGQGAVRLGIGALFPPTARGVSKYSVADTGIRKRELLPMGSFAGVHYGEVQGSVYQLEEPPVTS